MGEKIEKISQSGIDNAEKRKEMRKIVRKVRRKRESEFLVSIFSKFVNSTLK